MASPDTETPVDVLSADADGMAVGAPQEQHAAQPSSVSMGGCAFNPQLEMGANSPSQIAGCSTAVTPIPTFLPKIPGMEWVVGVIGAVIALLKSDEWDRRHAAWTSFVRETIDMNGFLPTSTDDMRDWNTLARS